ncbi:MAG: S41 family peptidase [Nannocystaceae bacterium]|nr:S41 family peptidase [bacterium]
MLARVGAVIALMLVACEPAAATAPTPQAKPDDPEVEVAEPQAAKPAKDACTDWSKADLSDLPPLPESRYRRTFEQAWRLVLEKHYDPTLGCVDWPAARLRYGEALSKTRDRTEAFEVINEMLDELGQSHVKLFSSGSDEAVGPASVDLRARWVQGKLAVVEAPPGAPVQPGAVLTSVDGTKVAELSERAEDRTERAAEFAALVARLAAAKLSCGRAGETRTVTLEGEDEPRTLPCIADPSETMSLGNLTDVPTRVEHRMVEGTKVGVIAFNVWMLPMLPKIQAALADLRSKGMKALVLDLRGNPGGVGPMAVSVARSLLTEPGSLGKLEMRAFTQEFNVSPDPDPFAGPVALLIDEGTASTSEIFAAGMRDLGRVSIYGAGPSAGAALPSLIEQLDGGALFQYVVGDYHSPKGVLVEGRGVAPDHLVPETVADFAAGKDPVLEAAVAALQES